MEGVPRMPMLEIELKQNSLDYSSLDWVGVPSDDYHEIIHQQTTEALKKHIRDEYGDDPEKFNGAVEKLVEVQSAAYKAILSPDFEGCNTLKKYYGQLHYMQSRFPFSGDDGLKVSFSWQDAFTGIQTVHESFAFEQSAILFNIGAVHSILGAADSRISEEGIRISCVHFQCAAGIFTYLSENFDTTLSPDISQFMLKLFINLMLAQGQECLLEKSMQDNRKHSIVSKISQQVVDYYKQCSQSLDNREADNVLGSSAYKAWKKMVNFKVIYYSAITKYYMGNNALDQDKYGQSVSYFGAGVSHFNELAKLAKNFPKEIRSKVDNALRFTSDVLNGKYNSAVKDNNFIYHDKVPDPATLPEIKGASLVKPLLFEPANESLTGPDIFAKLVPMEAHLAASTYSEEKAQLLRSVVEKIDEKNEVLNQYKSSIELDPKKLIDPSKEMKLDDALIEKCALLSADQSPITDLRQHMDVLTDVNSELDSVLNDIVTLVEKEESEDLKLKDAAGKEAFSTEEDVEGIKRELSVYTELFQKAGQLNEDLQTACRIHIQNMKVVAEGIDGIKGDLKLKDLSQLISDEDRNDIQLIRKLCDKVVEMEQQRKNLLEQLRQQMDGDDVISTLVTKHGMDQEYLFKEELKKYDSLIDTIDKNLSAQGNIFDAVTEANARYTKIKKVVETERERVEQRTQNLILSCDIAADVSQRCGEGKKFFGEILDKAKGLYDRAKEFHDENEEERKKIYKKIEERKKPPPRPSAPKPKLNKPADRKVTPGPGIGPGPGPGVGPDPMKGMILSPDVLAQMMAEDDDELLNDPEFLQFLQSQGNMQQSMQSVAPLPLSPPVAPHPRFAHIPRPDPTSVPGANSSSVAPSFSTPPRPIQPRMPPQTRQPGLPHQPPPGLAQRNLRSSDNQQQFHQQGGAPQMPISETPTPHSVTQNAHYQPGSVPQSPLPHPTPPRVMSPHPNRPTPPQVMSPKPGSDSPQITTHYPTHQPNYMPQQQPQAQIPAQIMSSQPGNQSIIAPHRPVPQPSPSPAPASQSSYRSADIPPHMTPQSHTGYLPSMLPQNAVRQPAVAPSAYQFGHEQHQSTPRSTAPDMLPPQSSYQPVQVPQMPPSQPAPSQVYQQHSYQAGNRVINPPRPGQGFPSQVTNTAMNTPGEYQVSQPHTQLQGQHFRSNLSTPDQRSHSAMSTVQLQPTPPPQQTFTTPQAQIYATRPQQMQQLPASSYPSAGPTQLSFLHNQAASIATPSAAQIHHPQNIMHVTPNSYSGSTISSGPSTLPQQQIGNPHGMNVPVQHANTSYFAPPTVNPTPQTPPPIQVSQVAILYSAPTTCMQSQACSQPNVYTVASQGAPGQIPPAHYSFSNPALQMRSQPQIHDPSPLSMGSQAQSGMVQPSFIQTRPTSQVFNPQSSAAQYPPLGTQMQFAGSRFPTPPTSQIQPQHQFVDGQPQIYSSMPPGQQHVGNPTRVPGPNQPQAHPGQAANIQPQQVAQPMMAKPNSLHVANPNLYPQPPGGDRPPIPGQNQFQNAAIMQGPQLATSSGLQNSMTGAAVSNYAPQHNSQQQPYLTTHLSPANLPIAGSRPSPPNQQTVPSQQHHPSWDPRNPNQQYMVRPPAPGTYSQPGAPQSTPPQQRQTVPNQCMLLGFPQGQQPYQGSQQLSGAPGNIQQQNYQRPPIQPNQMQGNVITGNMRPPVPGTVSANQQQNMLRHQNPLEENQGQIPRMSAGVPAIGGVRQVVPQPPKQPYVVQSNQSVPNHPQQHIGVPVSGVAPAQSNAEQQGNYTFRSHPHAGQFTSTPSNEHSPKHVPKQQSQQMHTGVEVQSAGILQPTPVNSSTSATTQLPPKQPSSDLAGIVLTPSRTLSSSADELLFTGTEQVPIPAKDTRQSVLIPTKIDDVDEKMVVRPIEGLPYMDEADLMKFKTEVAMLRTKVFNLLHKPDNLGLCELDREWKQLSESQEKRSRQLSTAIARCSSYKNRFQDIVPFDQSRVILKQAKDDYINASVIDGVSPYCPRFIATQSPLPNTISDFWLMVYEQQVNLIVMLVNAKDVPKKCPMYWPADRTLPQQHGPLTVSFTTSKAHGNLYVERTFTVKHERQSLAMSVTQLQYIAWPDHRLPSSGSDLQSFLRVVQGFHGSQRNLQWPILVHCESGVGRTGVFCAFATAINEINAGMGILDVVDIVMKMRQKRKYMVQEKAQLKFVYDVILYHAVDVLKQRNVVLEEECKPSPLPPPQQASFNPTVANPNPSGFDIFSDQSALSSIQATVAKMTIKPGPEREVHVPETQPMTSHFESKSCGDIPRAASPSIPGGQEMRPRTSEMYFQPTQDFHVTQPEPQINEMSDLVQGTINAPLNGNQVPQNFGSFLQASPPNPPDLVESCSNSPLKPPVPQSGSNETISSRTITGSPSSLIESLAPESFTLNLEDGGKKKSKITKADFHNPAGLNFEKDPTDPFSGLDPLWGLRK